MPYNVPTITTDDISFGPAILYMGAAGATPTVDVGAISEDGVTVEVTSEKKYITQGNPKLNVYAFSQAQGVSLKVSGIEWDFTNLAYAIGAGDTTASVSEERLRIGGDPLVTQVALHVQHYMAVSGNTMNVYVWKATSDAGFTAAFGADEHTFEYSFTAIRSTTDWASGALAATQQLVQFTREL
tara:strand:- start:311 stop:862 length:552 start_codon:yes stop_codon:yes gene_type:complete